jgi:hypothetical protein
LDRMPDEGAVLTLARRHRFRAPAIPMSSLAGCSDLPCIGRCRD